MKNYLDEIEKKIRNQIKLEELAIIDNSIEHVGHKFFSPDKLHLRLKIKSSFLNTKSRIEAQKLVMEVLKNDLKTKIHALEINIEK